MTESSSDENIVWINDEDEMFTKAKLLPTGGKIINPNAVFQNKVVDGKVNLFILRSASVNQFTLDKIHEYDESHESKSADISAVTKVHAASVFNIIKTRFQDGLPYTRVFTAMVALNLFEHTNDYSSEIGQYETLTDLEKCGHIFSVAVAAVGGVGVYNQSIILLGESGAGKTLVFNRLIPFICSGSVREKTSAASNVMEMFGNCMTRLNANSSRYTRFVRIRFKNGVPEGSEMMQVFLERGRVIARPKGESSFHVFYLLFASIIDGVESSNDVQLDPNAEYRYLDPLSRMRNDGERRELVRQFLRLLDDMALLGIDSKAQNDLCRTLAAIVLLGNVQFCRKGTDGSLGTDTDDSECTVDPACCDGPLLSQYLGVADISQLLTTKVIPGGRTSSFYQVGLTGSQARANADNLATGLYYKLFGWVVTVANSKSKLSVESCASTGRRLSAASHSNYVGILDMCGFEMSENNSSFEQLCVNYCNEKLYSVFYSEIFASELALLTSEGCPHTVPGGYDNTPCLSLLEGETGLIRLIDEHCVLSRAGQDDSTLLSLFCQHHPKNTHFECGLLAKRRSVGETRFKVQHYRGPVVYDITGFMNGNSEKIEIDSMLEGSTNDFIAALNTLKVEKPGDGTATNAASVRKASMTGSFVPRNNRRKIKKSKLTVCSDVRSNLAAFIGELQTTELQFITCVKPNETQTPKLFAPEYVMRQLRANGVMDIMRMNTQGYTLNLSWEELHEKFIDLGLYWSKPPKPKQSLLDTIEHIKSVFTASLQSHMWFVGSSGRVYLKSDVFNELLRQKSHRSSKIIQKNWRVHRLSEKLHRMCVSLCVIKRTLWYHVEAMRSAKALARLEEMCREYSYLLLRWRLRIRIDKRVSAKIATWFLRRSKWKQTMSRIIRSQTIICNIMQTKRLSLRFRKAKRAAVSLQSLTRGILCRRRVAPLLLELRQRLCDLKNRQSATKIYCAYRNFMLRKWVTKAFLAVRWGALGELEVSLREVGGDVPHCLRGCTLVDIRDFTSGYSSMLHMAVESELVDMVRLLLTYTPNVLSYDYFGCSPLGNIPSPPLSQVHAQLLSLLVEACPDVLFFPDKFGDVFDAYEQYQLYSEYADVPCGSSTLGITLKQLKWTKERVIAKAKHKEAMSKGSTIIPLYDPDNMHHLLRECIPSSDDAYVDLNSVVEESECDDNWDSSAEESEYESENSEGAQLKEKLKGMLFAEVPVGAIDKALLATAIPAMSSKKKGLPTQIGDGVNISSASGPDSVAGDALSVASSVSDSPFSSKLYLPTPDEESKSFIGVAAESADGSERPASKSHSPTNKRNAYVSPYSKYAVANDAKYRMLLAKRNALKEEPVLQFFAETRFASSKKS